MSKSLLIFLWSWVGICNLWAQPFAGFQEEYDFHTYLLREKYPEEAQLVLEGLLGRPRLVQSQQDSVHLALGRLFYGQQALSSSTAAYAKVSDMQPAMYAEATFFRAFNLAYELQPGVGAQVLENATFDDPQLQELKSYELAAMALLSRDYTAYHQHSDRFTGTYFAFAEQEKEIVNWARDLETYKPKRPGLAALLSALVPGLGRVYAGKAGQGLASFFQVAVFGFQAWEGYRKDGPISWRFITFTTIGSLFYVSNIVGSAYAAQQKNDEFYEAVDYRLRVDMHVPLRTLFR